MTHEYGDPFNIEAIDAAVAQTIALRRQAPEIPLAIHVEAAVHHSFCSCAIAIEDQIERDRSGLHDTIASEVTMRVERQLSLEDNEQRENVDEGSERPALDEATGSGR